MNSLKKRFYDPRHYDVMFEQDHLAVRRDPGLNMTSEMICVQCGNIERFKVKSTVNHLIKNSASGLKTSPMSDQLTLIRPGMKLSYPQLFDIYWETGNILVAICDECDGAVVPRLEVNRRCEQKRCMGCLLCGQVTPIEEMESHVNSCSDCMGGSNPCDSGGCRAWFMRSYYGYKPSPEANFQEIESYHEQCW